MAYVFNAGPQDPGSTKIALNALQGQASACVRALQEVEGFQILLSRIGKAVEKEYNDPNQDPKKKWMFDLGRVWTFDGQLIFNHLQLPEEDIVTSDSFEDEHTNTDPLAVLVIPKNHFIEFLHMVVRSRARPNLCRISSIIFLPSAVPIRRKTCIPVASWGSFTLFFGDMRLMCCIDLNRMMLGSMLIRAFLWSRRYA
ncbi:hypothetical protein P154DRAFT_527024 [Amniculicola lignicola CBS 123094]|uniref:Uncharacterized protein n=1 Tax=Amniculicola lignicola CBS 123094 TaxID=1392246 RepID=A0A6A5VYM8_9PLEO|nr:hypothetical protein P154DRAFT_527024 [Amniculicola lignicola CBS 123094]